MRYLGTHQNNFNNAVGANDVELQKDILLDKYAYLIQNYPTQVAQALQQSGISVRNPNSVKELINKVADNIHTNKKFQHQISVLVVNNTDNTIHSNTNGKSSGGGGANTGAIITGLTDLTSAIFGYASAKENVKAEQEQSKQALYGKILGQDTQKTWVLPAIIITGVLLVGGLIAFATLRRRKK
jgi:hypothetical protein